MHIQTFLRLDPSLAVEGGSEPQSRLLASPIPTLITDFQNELRGKRLNPLAIDKAVVVLAAQVAAGTLTEALASGVPNSTARRAVDSLVGTFRKALEDGLAFNLLATMAHEAVAAGSALDLGEVAHV